jgi:hypothetical protein
VNRAAEAIQAAADRYGLKVRNCDALAAVIKEVQQELSE